MNTWFTSDTHFGHENILTRFCPKTRQGRNIAEHDEILICQWNGRVGKNDTIYHLGDFFFCEEERANTILNRLNGRKIFIWGNHDKVISKSEKLKRHFAEIHNYLEITIDKQRIVLFHFPIAEWNKIHHGAFHLYGHVHGSLTLPGRALDVGIDTRDPVDMSPWSWDEVKRILSKREIRTHHGHDKYSHVDEERYNNHHSQKRP